MKLRLQDSFGLVPVNKKRSQAALPPYLRKCFASPDQPIINECGSAAGGEASTEVGDASVKHSFTENRQAEPVPARPPEPPTKPTITEAAEKGFYDSPGWNRDYPHLRISTVERKMSSGTMTS